MYALSVDPIYPGWFSAKFYPASSPEQKYIPTSPSVDGYLRSGRILQCLNVRSVATQKPDTIEADDQTAEKPTEQTADPIFAFKIVDANENNKVGVRVIKSYSASRESCRTYAKSRQAVLFLIMVHKRWFLCRRKSHAKPRLICEISKMLFNFGTQVSEEEITSLVDDAVQTEGSYEEVMSAYRASLVRASQSRGCGEDRVSQIVVTVEPVGITDEKVPCEVTVDTGGTVMCNSLSPSASETLDLITTDSAFTARRRMSQRRDTVTRFVENSVVDVSEINSSCSCEQCQQAE